MENFDGKVVVVTGAASGLGRATAIAFARAGATLSLADINGEGLQSLVAEIASFCTDPLCSVVDLSSREACLLLIADTIERHGGIDVLCNVAGVLGASKMGDVTERQWKLIMDINISAPFWLSQAAMPQLIAGGGNIVNVASSAAFMGSAYLVPYTTTKAALVQMTKSMAMEFIKDNVRINAIAPGGMHTNIADENSFPKDADAELMGRYVPIRDAVQPDVVADLILYLASDRAANIHGTCLSTDAGLTAG